MSLINNEFHSFIYNIALEWKNNLSAKKIIAERLMELGNLVFISMVVSQFFEDKANIQFVLGGSFLTIASYIFGYNLAKKGKYEY